MSSRRLDDIDALLLAILRDNARTSFAELATRVHLSRNAVRQRVERLERDGVIAGYTLAEPPTSASSTVALMFITRSDRVKGVHVIDEIRSISEITQCDVVSGELDLVVRVEAADAQRVREIWTQIAAIEGVSDTTTAWSLSTVVDRRR